MKKVYFTAAIALLLIGAGGYYMKDYHRDLNNTPSSHITGNAGINKAGGSSQPVTTPVAIAAAETCEASSTTTYKGSKTPRKERVYASADIKAVLVDIQQSIVDEAASTDQSVVIAPVVVKKELDYVKLQVFYGKAPKMRKVHFGPEIGLNQSSMYMTTGGDYHIAYMLKGGFHAGIVSDIRLNDHIALQPGIRYIQRGEQSNTVFYGDTKSVVAKNKLYTHNIEMPVNVVFKLGEVGSTRFLVGGGPYVSYLVDARSNSTAVESTDGSAADAPGTVFNVDRNISADGYIGASGSMRKLDYGVGAFIGCETPSGFFAHAGMEAGRRNLQKNDADGQYYNRNYSFLISFGYLLGAVK